MSGIHPLDHDVAIDSAVTRSLSAAKTSAVLAEHDSDFSFGIEVERNGTRIAFTVRLRGLAPATFGPRTAAWWGATLEDWVGGAHVRQTCGSKGGLVDNDWIVSLDGASVRGTPAAVVGVMLAVHDASKPVTLVVERSNIVRSITVSPTDVSKEAFSDGRIGRPAPEWHDPISVWGSIPDWLVQLRDKTVVLAFLSTTCDACVPYANELAAAAKAHPTTLRVFAITLENEKTARKDTRLPRDYPLVVDAGGGITPSYKAKDTPTIVVIDRRGMIAAVVQMSSTTEDRMMCAIERVIATP